MARRLTLSALDGVPEIAPGTDLVEVTLVALAQSNASLEPEDVLVVASKIVAKAEGRYVRLADIDPSPRACELAAQCGKDARVVELILAESTEIMRCVPGTLIVRHRLGCVLANAGIDESNLVAGAEDVVLLLPRDPDASAAALRLGLRQRSSIDVAVIVIDSLGRAWRQGVTGTAIGVSGAAGLVNLRGLPDRRGRPLRVTEVGAADELAAAASLVMGQADEGTPIVLARGVPYARRESSAVELLRPLSKDLFR